MDKIPLQVAVVAITVLLAGFVGIQVTDPFRTNGPTGVTLSEEPSEIAADALRVLHAVNHTQHVVTARENRTTGEMVRGRHVRCRYEPGEQQYSVTRTYTGSLPEDPDLFAFGTEGTAWTVGQISGEWTEDPRHRYTDRVPFDPSVVDAESVRVVSENETTLVLSIFGGTTATETVKHTIAYYPDQRGTLTLYVDKDTRRLDRAVYEPQVEEDDGKTRAIFLIEEYGTTEVARPNEVPDSSSRGVLWDVANGPAVRLENWFL